VFLASVFSISSTLLRNNIPIGEPYRRMLKYKSISETNSSLLLLIITE